MGPSPSAIGLDKEGQGYPTFDLPKAKEYSAEVNDTMAKLIEGALATWKLTGF